MLQVSILSVSVSIFNFVSVRLNCQCQFQFRFFVSGFTDIDSKLRYPYLSLSYAPWSEGGCLSSAKLRSTDSVNPRAVLSRVRPRYRLYSKHRDRRCWTGPGIGIRVSFRTFEEPQLFRTTREQESAVGSRPPHLNVALSKAALSGPSVCLRARAPCPLRVTCLRIARERSSRVPAGARQWTVPSSRSGDPVPHPPGPRGRAARAAGLRSSGWLLGTRHEEQAYESRHAQMHGSH